MAAGTERDESIAAIAREVADDAVRLARAEIELAKAEAIAALKRLAIAIGLLAGAGVFALFMTISALGAVPTALAGRVFSGWTWWLLMAAFFLIIAALLAMFGFRSLKRGIGTGKQMVGSVKEDVAWLKRLTKRNAKES
ncbi:MAG TPA: phage holin family protein [Candidatus Dormibacteraeota bacterium]|nr:phage holin family protein [Candidatus Dormibacteraeota bacterium]